MTTPIPFRRGRLRGLLLLATLSITMLPAEQATQGRLRLERSADEIVITSDAGPTWRVVLATHSPASVEQPGGGVVRALHVPADNPASVVGTVPMHFAFGPWGLDNLEWRYVVKGAKWGTRQALGVDSTIDRIRVVREFPTEIEILIEGHWENVPRFTRRITFDPGGWRVRVEADWDGPDQHYGMWWMWSLFHGAAMDNQNVTIQDADTAPLPLPIFKGNVERVPDPIDFPYVITFPLQDVPAPHLQLRINEFGGDSKRGPCYELWPEEKARRAVDEHDTYKTFMPRWVAGGIAQRTYNFDYEWRVDGGATAPPPPPPYAASPVFSGLDLDWSTHRRAAPGSDNFQLTWADDDHLYGSWGDGGGFDGDNQRGRVDLGVARIEGTPDDYRGANVWGGFEAESPATFGGKSWGMIAVDSDLYMWTVPGGIPGKGYRNPFEFIELAWSQDRGRTWQKVDWTFTSQENLTIPTFLNFGRGNTGVPPRLQGYVYSYFIQPEDPDMEAHGPNARGMIVHRPGAIYLARIAEDKLPGEKSDHEFFAGLDDSNNPRWGNVSEKVPVWEDANGAGWCVSAVHHPESDRILLVTEHERSRNGLFGVFDAPNPWGPWTTVSYYQRDEPFGNNRPGSDLPWSQNLFYFSFIPKWFDGDAFVLSFTGAGRGQDNDSFNTIRGRLLRR